MNCQAKKMRIVSKVTPNLDQLKVVGITTSVGCSKDATYTLSLDNTDSVTESKSFTTGTSKSFSFGVSISVEASANFAPLGLGGTITAGIETSFDSSFEWSSEETKEFSKDTSSSAGQSLEYQGKFMFQ